MLYVVAIAYLLLSFFNLTDGNQLPPYIVSAALLVLAVKSAVIEYMSERIDDLEEDVEDLETQLNNCINDDDIH